MNHQTGLVKCDEHEHGVCGCFTEYIGFSLDMILPSTPHHGTNQRLIGRRYGI